MSLKENIDMVKEELSQEEKFFAGAVQTERFVKKYKKPILGGIAAIIIFLIGSSLYQASVDEAIKTSNEAYLKLIVDKNDAASASILKDKNPSLYDAWQLKVAVDESNENALEGLRKSTSTIVSDLATYELAVLHKDKAALNSYALEQDAILKDLAILNEAVLLMQEGKTADAKSRLDTITDDSPLKKLAMLLQHYGVQ